MNFGSESGSSEETDYSAIPLMERLDHKVWKARQNAYEELTKLFQDSPSEEADCFKEFLRDSHLIRKIALDINAMAQEVGMAAICSFVEFGGPTAAIRTREAVVPAISEKGINAAKAVTKAKSLEALLWYCEMDTPDPVLQFIVPQLSARIPKLVASNVKAMTEIYKSFGCRVCSPKIALDILPKLFGHADRNVRSEAVNLSVTIRSYIGKPFDNIILEQLKPAQQKELNKAFEKIEGVPTPSRIIKSEQAKEEELSLQDVHMEDADGAHGLLEEVDEDAAALTAYNLVDPIDVLSKMPADFDTRINSAKWKERKEVLEETLKEFKVVRMKVDDYSYLTRILVKCLRDANIFVVTLACNMIDAMGEGLRTDFNRYIGPLLNPLLDRTKEKKPSVSEALANALNTCFKYSSFEEVLEPTLEHMKHKTPQIKIESIKFLSRCLSTTKVIPEKSQMDPIVEVSAKLLSDSQAPVRNGSCEVLGTLMKMIGERAFKPYLENVDSRHIKKVEESFNGAIVAAKPKSATAPPVKKPVATANGSRPGSRPIGTKPPLRSQKKPVSKSEQKPSSFATSSAASAPSRMAPKTGSPTTSRRSSLLPNQSRSSIPSGSNLRRPSDISHSNRFSSSSIPSKRTATSPLKGASSASKMNLTSRSLQPLNTPMQYQEPQETREPPPMSSAEKQELETLRAEKETWSKEKEGLEASLKYQTTLSEKYLNDLSVVNVRLEEYQNQFTTLNLTVKSKETQLYRLQSDLENSKTKIMNLEQRLLQTQQLNQSILSNSNSSGRIGSGSPVKSEFDNIPMGNEANTSYEDRSELNRRISGLSIQSVEKENLFGSNSTSRFASGIYDLDSNDDSWKKAAEVTNQLKARIEQMKARTRTLNPL